MYGQSTNWRAKFRFAAIDSRVSSGFPTIKPPTTNMPLRRMASTAASVALLLSLDPPRVLFFAAAGLSLLFDRRKRKKDAAAGLLPEAA